MASTSRDPQHGTDVDKKKIPSFRRTLKKPRKRTPLGVLTEPQASLSTSTSQEPQHGNDDDEENNPPCSSAERLQRCRKRTALAVLTNNHQLSSSVSESSHVSKPSSVSETSQFFVPSCLSPSSFDVYVDESADDVLCASGQLEVVEHDHMDTENEDMNEDMNEDTIPLEELRPKERFSVDYAEDIYHHLRNSEMKFQSKPYSSNHPQISSSMRVILVDWLAEVVQEYKLHTETLHLAVSYVDHFLSHTASVTRGKLQLVGTAALMIAAKFEEILPPELSEFVYITDSTYSKNEVIRMEKFILQVLSYRMALPTTHQFLRLFMSIHSVCKKIKHLAQYLAEISLLEMDPFLQYHPSMIAAGAYCLACYTLNQSLWPDSLSAFSGYTMSDIMPCMTDLHKLHIVMEIYSHQIITKKYRSSRYSGVSKLPPADALPRT